MSKEDFIRLVQESAFLKEERQKELTNSAEWMTDAERDFLAKSIVKTGQTIADNEQQLLKQLEEIESAVLEFKKVELPKILKEKEKGEEKSTAESAEALLKTL